MLSNTFRLLVGFALSCFGHSLHADERPNILIILADDLGYHDVGFHGLQEFRTPHLDALARQGIVCYNGYASHPFCAPSRAGLLTGRYQHRFGFEGNPTKADPQQGLPASEQTLARCLRGADYNTVCLGKWHLGEMPYHHPLRHGFERFFGLLEGSRSYFKTRDLSWERLESEVVQSFSAPSPKSRQGYLTDLLTDEAVRYIHQDHPKPFFMYLSYTAPHAPLQAPKYWLDRTPQIQDKNRRTYAAMVTAMDDGIGKVRAALKESGNDNTLIFFFSDNGGIGPVNFARNDPFSGLKGTLLEGGVRVPYVVHWENRLKPGRFGHSVITFDAFATSLAAAGVEPESDTTDAVNLLPFLEGSTEGPVHDVLYWRCGNGFQLAARKGNLKYLHVDGMQDRYFDLSQDPTESNSLSPKNILKQLTQEWSDDLPVAEFTALGTKHEEQWRALGLSSAPKRGTQNRK